MNISQIKKIIYEEITNVLIDLEDPYMLTESVYYNLVTEGELKGEPMTPNELRDLLRKKVVNFEFIKLNGEQRPARGTLRMDMIPQIKHPKGIRPSNKQKTVTYYDLDKDDWRSVSTKSNGVVLKDTDGKEASVVITDEPIDNQVTIEDEPKDDEVIINDEPTKDNGEVIITEPSEEVPSEEEIEELPIEEPSETKDTEEEIVLDTEEPSEEESIEEIPTEEDDEVNTEVKTDENGENTVYVNKELRKSETPKKLKIDKDGKGIFRLGKTIPNKKGYVKDGTYRNPIKIRLRNKKDLDRLKNSKFGENTQKTEKDLRLENPTINNPFETKPLTKAETEVLSNVEQPTEEIIKDNTQQLSADDIEEEKKLKFESINNEYINSLRIVMEQLSETLCNLE